MEECELAWKKTIENTNYPYMYNFVGLSWFCTNEVTSSTKVQKTKRDNGQFHY